MQIKVNIMNNLLFLYAGTIVMTLFIGYIDYLTGYEFNFFVFYYVSIASIAWRTKIHTAISIAVFSIIIWLLADILADHNYSTIFNQIWNTFMRFLSFLLIAFVISRLRGAVHKEKKISEDLRIALSKVKTLEGLLPICAKCKKIKHREGYWEQVEAYISRHSNLIFSHGLCEECAKELYPELYSDQKDSNNIE